MNKAARKSQAAYDLGPFRFRTLDGKTVVTNDAGEFAILEQDEFDLFTSGAMPGDHSRFMQLKSMGAILENGAFPQPLVEKMRRKNLFLLQGPQLFIIVATVRCNMKCVYCHASAGAAGDVSLDMPRDTARRVIDSIFNTPTIDISLEFQGGEPLLNWDTVTHACDYAIEKNSEAGKNMMISLVSNLTLLDDAKLDFLVSRKVGLCTSIDGPEALHNANRGGGYRKTVSRLKKVIRRYSLEFDRYNPAALTTVTRASLSRARDIVDTYASLGFGSIHLRPLNPVGFAAPVIRDIGYSPEAFLEFYEQALDYIIDLNKKGTLFVDRAAWIFLMKMFGAYDPNFLDLRSPCGAGIGQIAYHYNGDVYTCDEGRMLAMQGDNSFRMGSVFENSYDELIDSLAVKRTCLASVLDGIPHCHNCAYKPYCGVCPLLNYVEEGSLFTNIPGNRRHIIYQGILDMLFRRVQDPGTRQIFTTWLERGIHVI